MNTPNLQSSASRGGHSNRHNSGFTMTEMLIVLVIIALLVALIAPNFLGRLGGARSQSARTQIENLAGSLELFKIDTGRYPTASEGLRALEAAPDGAVGWSGPYLRRGGVPLDPWGNTYLYQSNSADHFTLSSLGRDGVAGGDGEDADLQTSTELAPS